MQWHSLQSQLLGGLRQDLLSPQGSETSVGHPAGPCLPNRARPQHLHLSLQAPRALSLTPPSRWDPRTPCRSPPSWRPRASGPALSSTAPCPATRAPSFVGSRKGASCLLGTACRMGCFGECRWAGRGSDTPSRTQLGPQPKAMSSRKSVCLLSLCSQPESELWKTETRPPQHLALAWRLGNLQ